MVYAYYNWFITLFLCIILIVTVDYLSKARVEQELILLQFNNEKLHTLQECN